MRFIITLIILFSILLSSQIISHTQTYENGNIKSIYYHQKIGDQIKKVKCEEFFENGHKYRQ